MSATSRRKPRRRIRSRLTPRDADPRVIRSKAAVLEAGKALFLEKGYAGTTIEEIAARAGIAKRTVYNNYPDKETLFRQILEDVVAYAEHFARNIPAELDERLTAGELPVALHAFGRHLALGILRPDVIALRRLLIGETRNFPELPAMYFDRAPGRVIAAIAARFTALDRSGALHAPDAQRAAEQFAYLLVAMPLDRAMLIGETPTHAHIVAGAREGVETFLARHGVRKQGVRKPGATKQGVKKKAERRATGKRGG